MDEKEFAGVAWKTEEKITIKIVRRWTNVPPAAILEPV